jgi:hypothetical protein
LKLIKTCIKTKMREKNLICAFLFRYSNCPYCIMNRYLTLIEKEEFDIYE